MPTITKVKKEADLNKDLIASGEKLLKLKNNRADGDIPLTDEYWITLKEHEKLLDPNK